MLNCRSKSSKSVAAAEEDIVPKSRQMHSNIWCDRYNGAVTLHKGYFAVNPIYLLRLFLKKLLVAGGGMYVEVFNRGVIPLAYGIKKKNRAGESNTYLDGIYLLFTYFTKPETLEALETMLKKDDDIIRSSSFKIRKRKY